MLLQKQSQTKPKPTQQSQYSVFQTIIKITLTWSWFSFKLRLLWPFHKTFGRKEFRSDPQSNSSQSPLQKRQSGIAVLPEHWARTQGIGETWRALHHLITQYRIQRSLQEHNSNSTHFPCSTQDLFAASCLQPPHASKTLHLFLLSTKACSYSTSCLASFVWHPWTHPLGSAFFPFHWMPSLWYVSELITGDNDGAEVREKNCAARCSDTKSMCLGLLIPALPFHIPQSYNIISALCSSLQEEIYCA